MNTTREDITAVHLVHWKSMVKSIRTRQIRVPVVDVFAGPGGLSEGFSALQDIAVSFNVNLSVEKDPEAYKTLRLRAFFRQFPSGAVPSDYYRYLRGQISSADLFAAHPIEAANAVARCIHLEMGPRSTSKVYAQIDAAVSGSDRWVLVGGPPCQAYSVVGRSRLTQLKRDKFEEDEKHVLYREYLRVLARYTPPIFVMENVKGLLSAKFAGTSIFERILSDLSSPTVAVREAANGQKPQSRRGSEYSILSLVQPSTDPSHLRPQDYVIEAEKFGVPQNRHRVILLGVRSDISIPSGLALRPSVAPTVRNVLDDLPAIRSQLSREPDGAGAWVNAIRCALAKLSTRGIDSAIGDAMCEAAANLDEEGSPGGRWVTRTKSVNATPARLQQWFLDPKMDFVCNHESRKHISSDLLRYLFVSSFAKIYGVTPKLTDFPEALLPNHKNVQETLRLKHGNFNDRFRVQSADLPATTVTSHISKDGHYFIHHDVTQCRSWTVREAARVQTFPDNYFFEGTRTDQYRQVGNAVPPYLAVQIARVVASVLKSNP